MTNKWKHQTLSLIGLLICSPLFVQLQQSCVLWSNETGTGGGGRISELMLNKQQK